MFAHWIRLAGFFPPQSMRSSPTVPVFSYRLTLARNRLNVPERLCGICKKAGAFGDAIAKFRLPIA